MNDEERTQLLKRVIGLSETTSRAIGFIRDFVFPAELVGGFAYLRDQENNIVPHEEYSRLRTALDAFYAQITPSEIAAYNAKPTVTKRAEVSRQKWGSIYVMRFRDRYKIGMTTISAESRRQETEYELRRHVDASANVELIRAYETNHPFDVEKKLHAEFDEKRLEGEWFALSETDVQAIDAIMETSQ